MGIGVSAAHLVIFLALASAGTVLASTLLHTMADNTEAQTEAGHRLREAANERFSLDSGGYGANADRAYANFTNDGSDEIALDDVTLLVGGTVTASSSVAVFEVAGNPTSNLWMPGETVNVRVDGQGDVDVGIVGPHGTAAYRRA